MSALQLDLRGKTYARNDTHALEAIQLDVRDGEFVALVGPSGAGKSTLLNIVIGLDRDFEGEIVLERASTRRAMVFQTPRLMPWLTVRGNVELVLPACERHDAHESVSYLLERLELTEFADAFPGQLSGGMQRRVSLARAFAVRPGLLLMDEPFVSLDDPLAWRLREQLDTLWQESRPTVLYVTHDLTEALSLADRVVFLSARPGRVVHEERLTIARPRLAGNSDVAALRESLLARHPDLLAGRVTSDAEGAQAPLREVPAA